MMGGSFIIQKSLDVLYHIKRLKSKKKEKNHMILSVFFRKKKVYQNSMLRIIHTLRKLEI